MKIVKVTRYFLEFFMTQDEEVGGCRIKKGLPDGCKLVLIEFDGEIATLYFAEKGEEGLPMNPEMLPKVGGDLIVMEFERIDK